jgi:hypothetical protein
MLLGEALDDLKKENTHRVIGGQLYRLDDKDNDNTKKDVLHKPNDFSVNRQEITQTAEERMIQVAYTYIKEYKEGFCRPVSLFIHTKRKEI